MDYPKTNTRLRFGDFGFVPRDDGHFALFVYLHPVSNARMYFYCSFAQVVLDFSDIKLLPEQVPIGRPAMTSIKCYRENELTFAGNLAERISESDKTMVQHVITDMSVGAVSTVWGHLTIPRHANEVLG